MTIIIKKTTVDGAVEAQASKSVMQRLVAASLLSNGTSEIVNYGKCNDSKTSINIAKQLGAKIHYINNSLFIDGGLNYSPSINCNESGLSVRMFSPIVALLNKEVEVTGDGTLLARPMNIIEEALHQLNVSCVSQNSFLPLKIKGPIESNKIKIDASLSSQLLTGLLFALPLASKPSTIIVENLNSKPYIDLSLSILKSYGIIITNNQYKEFKIKNNQKYIAQKTTVEGDWSSASNLLVAAAIAGNIKISGLNINSFQADKKILEVLKKVGAKITITNKYINVEKLDLQAFDFDATDCPDLFPILTVLALNCKGKSTIKGVNRLKHKESDRAKVIKNEFSKLGAKIQIIDNIMNICGGKTIGAKVKSNNDHRIAMALAIAGLNSEKDIEICNFDAINKSYPLFIDDLKRITTNCIITNN